MAGAASSEPAGVATKSAVFSFFVSSASARVRLIGNPRVWHAAPLTTSKGACFSSRYLFNTQLLITPPCVERVTRENSPSMTISSALLPCWTGSVTGAAGVGAAASGLAGAAGAGAGGEAAWGVGAAPAQKAGTTSPAPQRRLRRLAPLACYCRRPFGKSFLLVTASDFLSQVFTPGYEVPDSLAPGFQGTGSYPCPPKGRQRRSRWKAIPTPRHVPHFSTAS